MDISERRGTKRSRGGAAKESATKRARPTTMIVRRRSSALRPETKFFDTSLLFTVGSAGDWTGTEVTCSNYIQSDGATVGAYTDSALIPSALGTGYGQIQGTKYLLRSVHVRGEIQGGVGSDQADMISGRSVRLVLVQDMMPQGQQAQGEVIFTDLGIAAQCNYSYLALGAGTGGRFKILQDKVVMLQPATAGTDGTNTNSLGWNTASFKMSFVPKRPIEVQCKASGTTPAVSQLSNCNIFLLAHAAGTTPTITLVGAARCAYVD